MAALAVIVALASAGCSASSSINAPASPSVRQPYPWLADYSITLADGSATVCVASLIAPQWLVTDAHGLMLTPVTPSQIQVRVGSTTRGTGGVLDSVSAIVPAPDWDQNTAAGDV